MIVYNYIPKIRDISQKTKIGLLCEWRKIFFAKSEHAVFCDFKIISTSREPVLRTDIQYGVSIVYHGQFQVIYMFLYVSRPPEGLPAFWRLASPLAACQPSGGLLSYRNIYITWILLDIPIFR